MLEISDGFRFFNVLFLLGFLFVVLLEGGDILFYY